MTSIAIFGVTGYSGGNLARAAIAAGLDVQGYSRSAPEQPLDGVQYHQGSIEDSAVTEGAAALNDVVISAVSPRGEMAGKVAPAIGELAEVVRREGKRLGVIGGAGSLQVAEGGPTLAQSPGFPEEFAAEAGELAAVLEALRGSEDDLDWFFVSPAAAYGAANPGEHRGTYRVGGDVLLTDEDGNSDISGADFADAVVAEIAEPAHHRSRFTVAY